MVKSDSILQQKANKIKWFFTDVDGTLTDGLVYYSASGEELKSFSLRDGTGFFLLRSAGIKTGFITGENSQIVLRRAEKLQVDKCCLNVKNKVDVMGTFISEHNLNFDEIAYIGDDLNDIRLMKKCGLSFAVADADYRVKNIADYVCEKPGGRGAFREAVEILLMMRGLNINQIIDNKL